MTARNPFTGEALAGTSHDPRKPRDYAEWRRGEARRRKDRHVPYGPTADASPVERTSERASGGNLNRSEADRWDRRRAAMATEDSTLLDAVVDRGGMDAIRALAELREALPRE